jgi:hypothetical protein
VSWRPDPQGDGIGPRRVDESINLFLTRTGHAEIPLFSKVVEVWESVVGKGVADHVRPAAIADDTLVVEVDGSGWSTELTFLAPRLLAALERRLETHVASSLKARMSAGSGVE